jgi:hypothetical protein
MQTVFHLSENEHPYLEPMLPTSHPQAALVTKGGGYGEKSTILGANVAHIAPTDSKIRLVEASVASLMSKVMACRWAGGGSVSDCGH